MKTIPDTVYLRLWCWSLLFIGSIVGVLLNELKGLVIGSLIGCLTGLCFVKTSKVVSYRVGRVFGWTISGPCCFTIAGGVLFTMLGRYGTFQQLLIMGTLGGLIVGLVLGTICGFVELSEQLIEDKSTNNILYALMSFAGLMGVLSCGIVLCYRVIASR